MKNFKVFLIIIISVTIGAYGWHNLSPLFLDKESTTDVDQTAKTEPNESSVEESSPSSNTNPQGDAESSMYNERAISSGPYKITGTSKYPASGQIEVIQTPEENLIRYLNYEGTSGPDLHIYLSEDLEARYYIDLGEQKADAGSMIYGMPLDVDLREYKYILTWSEELDELFDYAEIK